MNAPKPTNVQVAVRCRPANAEEKKARLPTVVSCNSGAKSVEVSYGPAGKKTNKDFNFDRVFGAYSTQEEVFNQLVKVRPASIQLWIMNPGFIAFLSSLNTISHQISTFE